MYKPWHGRTIPIWELPPAAPGSPLAAEWDFYQHEVARLLAEGHAGRHVLIKGSEIIGIYDTYQEASAEGSRRFFGQDVFIHQIEAEEPLIRCSFFWRGWPRKLTQ